MNTSKKTLLAIVLLGAAILGQGAYAANFPSQTEHDFVITNFQFHSGQTLPELRIHYATFGKIERDGNGVVRNAVLILHGTTGSCGQFLGPEFAGELFGKGQPLDVSRYFLIIPDGIGHGRSSKPSDGLRAKFPNYGYLDMVEAQYRLVTEGLGVNHLRLAMGTSMGGMHTWLWGEKHPDFMDALMPLASEPGQIAGRNRIWRRMIIDSIRNSPDWENGNYQAQPAGLRVAAETLYFMGENPVMRLAEGPTLKQEDERLDHYVTNAIAKLDANDVLYALAASMDYDPAPGLDKIRATLLAVNSADDLINPPELGVLDQGVKQVKHGQAMVIPYSDQTVGHGSHTKAVLWKKDLADLLNRTEKN
ncbi:MAG TPA: alpha/beta fold hydrolase [Verrucomicrobiae bacterium]|nr:alpha/beta fold hydrolase [Verrucomicrobiae bacterium]